MTLYSKYIGHSAQIRKANEIEIIENGIKIENPTEEQILADGWTVFMRPVDPVKIAKEEVIELITKYDSSDYVNVFYIGDDAMWLDKATRVGLSLRFTSETEKGMTETVLWHNGKSYTLPLYIAVKILHALELYASECYDNTQRHIGIVQSMANAEEIKAYNYKEGYPDILRF